MGEARVGEKERGREKVVVLEDKCESGREGKPVPVGEHECERGKEGKEALEGGGGGEGRPVRKRERGQGRWWRR